MTDLEHARRERNNALANANSARYDDEDSRLKYLERACEAQREVARIERLRKGALLPCNLCGRKVDSPCHSVEGMIMDGPWDFACDEYRK